MIWSVEVLGDKSDLKYLCDSLNTPEANLREMDGRFVLESKWFSEEKNLEEVTRIADRLLSTLNGSVKILLDSRVPLKLNEIIAIHPCGRKERITPVESQCLNLRQSVTVVKKRHLDGTDEIYLPTDPILQWIPLAMKCENVEKALRLLGKELNWVQLYRIYEVIRDDLKGKPSIETRQWESKSRIRSFTNSADNTKVSGDECRHGTSSYEPPSNPMSLPAARQMIKNIFFKWIEYKIENDRGRE